MNTKHAEPVSTVNRRLALIFAALATVLGLTLFSADLGMAAGDEPPVMPTESGTGDGGLEVPDYDGPVHADPMTPEEEAAYWANRLRVTIDKVKVKRIKSRKVAKKVRKRQRKLVVRGRILPAEGTARDVMCIVHSYRKGVPMVADVTKTKAGNRYVCRYRLPWRGKWHLRVLTRGAGDWDGSETSTDFDA